MRAVKETVGVVLGGGKGTRLFPLTAVRSKPAVPLAGKYRLIDVPISNCINSGIVKVYVLTQYNSASLNSHINLTYQMGTFSRGFVVVLAAEQTPDSAHWFQGTADAVRQSLRHIFSQAVDYVVVLSGDQLYRMDYRDLIRTHEEHSADITVSTLPVEAEQAAGFGVLSIAPDGRIEKFHEKPTDPGVVSDLSARCAEILGAGSEASPRVLASMGIYVFNAHVLREVLSDENAVDFGGEIIPGALTDYRVYGHVFQGYWEDIGTIRAFYEANLALTHDDSAFTFYNEDFPIYTHPRFLPPSWLGDGHFDECVIADGCLVEGRVLRNCVIGIRSIIGRDVEMHNTLMMGVDDHRPTCSENVPIGIGTGSKISNAIIDKNARIGKGVVIENRAGVHELDAPNYFIREGLVIIPKNAVIPDGTII